MPRGALPQLAWAQVKAVGALGAPEIPCTPARKGFVTKLLPSCYGLVISRVDNGRHQARCPTPFPLCHPEGTGVSTPRGGEEAGADRTTSQEMRRWPAFDALYAS
jgi:hypothetical protein